MFNARRFLLRYRILLISCAEVISLVVGKVLYSHHFTCTKELLSVYRHAISPEQRIAVLSKRGQLLFCLVHTLVVAMRMPQNLNWGRDSKYRNRHRGGNYPESEVQGAEDGGRRDAKHVECLFELLHAT